MPVAFVEEAEGFDDEGVFPDNQHAVYVFSRMLTQWRAGANGLIGLDYTALRDIPLVRRMSEEEYEDMFDGFQVMEIAALSAIRSRDAES